MITECWLRWRFKFYTATQIDGNWQNKKRIHKITERFWRNKLNAKNGFENVRGCYEGRRILTV